MRKPTLECERHLTVVIFHWAKDLHKHVAALRGNTRDLHLDFVLWPAVHDLEEDGVVHWHKSADNASTMSSNVMPSGMESDGTETDGHKSGATEHTSPISKRLLKKSMIIDIASLIGTKGFTCYNDNINDNNNDTLSESERQGNCNNNNKKKKKASPVPPHAPS